MYVCMSGGRTIGFRIFAFFGFLIYDIWKNMWQLLLKREKDLVIFIKIQKRSFLYPPLLTYMQCVLRHMGAVWHSVSDGIFQL